MRHLWRPIAELSDRYAPNLLLRAPELVDLDCNPHGIGMGYWQDDAEEFGDKEGSFLACKWSMTNDEWYEKACRPTHFLVLEGPTPSYAIVGEHHPEEDKVYYSLGPETWTTDPSEALLFVVEVDAHRYANKHARRARDARVEEFYAEDPALGGNS